MKFKTLKGREVNFQLRPSQYPLRSKESSRSNSQYHLGQQLKALFPGEVILEEFPIPDTRLSLDFYLPQKRLAFEFQGSQHDEYNLFFHATKADFERQKVRDQDKRQWCNLNTIRLIEVRNSCITLEELTNSINEAFTDE
jgi:hypothetical protein